jgi:hypothetical protein
MGADDTFDLSMSTKRPPLAEMMLLVMGGAAAAMGQGAIETFDAGKAAQPPSGFTFAAMRQPSPGPFLVRRTDAGGHLVHAADTAATGFAFAISPQDPLSDVVISVRLRLAGGSRAGGVVWRYVDASNFYAAVLDLGRAELSLYRVTNGNMIRIEQERELELDGEAWHSLKVVHDNADVRVSLGGIRVFTEDERRHSRLLARGRAGLVAAGAAEVWFDDLRIASGRNRR